MNKRQKQSKIKCQSSISLDKGCHGGDQAKEIPEILFKEGFVIQVTAVRRDSVAQCRCVNSKAGLCAAGQLSLVVRPCYGSFAPFQGFFKSFISSYFTVVPRGADARREKEVLSLRVCTESLECCKHLPVRRPGLACSTFPFFPQLLLKEPQISTLKLGQTAPASPWY